MRGVERIFGTARQTLARWIGEKAQVASIEATSAQPDGELDELWSFVRTKRNQRWLWIALCRRTRQVGATAAPTVARCANASIALLLLQRLLGGVSTGL